MKRSLVIYLGFMVLLLLAGCQNGGQDASKDVGKDAGEPEPEAEEEADAKIQELQEKES